MSRSPDGFVTRAGRTMFRVADVDALPPFLMTIPSASDHWLYLSSAGGLTAGRVEPDRALFPYVTEDRLHAAAGRVGPVTLLRWAGPDGAPTLWEPFRVAPEGDGARRFLYKTVLGDRVCFETVDETRGFTCSYGWSTSDRFGFVRDVTLRRHEGHEAVTVDLLDGLLELLPAGIDVSLQQQLSVLGDAYKQAEVDDATGLAIYSLTSRIVDRPEPAEALRATVAWQRGLEDATIALDARAVARFRRGEALAPDAVVRGRPGAFLVGASVTLAPGEALSWAVVADVDRSQADVVALVQQLGGRDDARAEVDRDVAAGVEALARTVARADGDQVSADDRATTHHRANVLFNVMRGGVFADHLVPRDDLVAFLGTRNRAARDRFLAEMAPALPARIAPDALRRAAAATGDADLVRLCAEYLPLTFSRRHGDPSRPWNRFAIRVRNADGSERLDYEGNWRDIFQNWEALCLSFPAYLESVVALFVNASTVDGFNPYRITRAGIDWEVPDPDDPWANIGYWGDHQIVYLTKLLEASRAHHPERLPALLDEAVFAYADVPYRLRPYADIVADPHETVVFDEARHALALARVAQEGSDGRLLHDADGAIVHVTLAEKLLVPLLSKLSNLVLGAGIWMNTQRPEWNDANNALVGYGVSQVTHAYLLRYVGVVAELLATLDAPALRLSARVADWLDAVHGALARHRGALEDDPIDEGKRRRLLDDLGEAFSHYRARVHEGGPGDATTRPVADVRALLALAAAHLERGVRASRREDGLYHAYELLDLDEPGRARVSHLAPMLEGQVAILSTDALDHEDAVSLLDALFASPLYWPAQRSFLLYPRRELPRFLEKNRVPDALVNPLLAALLEYAPGRIVERDAKGVVRFASDFRNARDLAAALDELRADPVWTPLVATHRAATLAAWEAVFHHRSFTGRSGTMVGYEGIGCIYWHMVSKLLLAVGERFLAARRSGAGEALQRALAERYYAVRAGLGFNKTVAEYGAVPIDPYSHTAPDGGARQPGMTGQVKEEVLTRRIELGVSVEDGRVRFDPALLRRRELLATPREWRAVDAAGDRQPLTVPAGGVGFTLCQVPVLYHVGDHAPAVVVRDTAGRETRVDGLTLPAAASVAVFTRTGAVTRLDVSIPSGTLLLD